MNKKTPAGVCLSLEEFNRIQRAAGLPERVAVKTLKSNKRAQAANRAAKAQANRDTKANRQKRGK